MSDFVLNIQWVEAPANADAVSATEAVFALKIGDVLVWGGSDKPVQWHLSEFLQFLTDNWKWLMLEQDYPISLNPVPASPMELRSASESRWQGLRQSGNLSDSEWLKEEEQVFNFEQRHNIARAFNGFYIKDVFLFRRNGMFEVCFDSRRLRIDYLELKANLGAIGDAILSRIGRYCDQDTFKAYENAWLSREPIDNEFAMRLWFGRDAEMSRAQREFLQRYVPTKSNDGFKETVFHVAAKKMADSRIGKETAMLIFESVNKVSLRKTPELDKLSKLYENSIPAIDYRKGKEPANCGRSLAQWFRGTMGWKARRDAVINFNPRDIMGGWGVALIDIEAIETGFDAMACWGDNNGPIVFLNLKSSRNKKDSGLRVTLAHEICHLIADRLNASSFAEILNGAEDETMEQRARAFAAELLMPIKLANALLDEDVKNMTKSIKQMSADFNVSTEVVAWQCYRSVSKHSISEERKNILREYVSNPNNLI